MMDIKGTRDAELEYFDDESTIPKVVQAKTLYARWQEKSCKVQYYKGTADRVAFYLVRRLTPKNGGNWIGKRELDSGDGFTLCYYSDDNRWLPFNINGSRVLTKKNGAKWGSVAEIEIGDGGKWYLDGTGVTKSDLKTGDLAMVRTID